jgi:Fic-DOC domain mobile mystery protein B
MVQSSFGPEDNDATPLLHEDLLGLIPRTIATRGELNFAEAANIATCLRQYSIRQLNLSVVLDDLFVRNLHRDMFGQVWDWAGKYRTRETTIGIDPVRIASGVLNLMGDAKVWLESPNSSDLDAAIAQIHHRLVAIHPFRNGNGRLCRFFADLLLESVSRPPFTWSGNLPLGSQQARTAYIAALRKADEGDYSALINFLRSKNS